jgi:2-oxoglutarate dehydrogenase E1 component
MGYWEFLAPLLREALDAKIALRYAGRPRSASPSEGSSAWHAINQRLLVEQAFQVDPRLKDPAPQETVKR